MYALLKPVWVAATSVISSRFTRSQLWPCCYAYHIGIYIPSGYVKITIENGPCSSWIYPLKMVVFHSYGTVYQTVSLFIIIQRYSPASLDGHGNPKLSAQWLEPKTCKNVLSLKIKKINKLKPLTYTTPHNHILPWCISGITIGYIMHIYTHTHMCIYIYSIYAQYLWPTSIWVWVPKQRVHGLPEILLVPWDLDSVEAPKTRYLYIPLRTCVPSQIVISCGQSSMCNNQYYRLICMYVYIYKCI